MGASGTIRLSSVLSALSYALDLTEGHPSGHASRTCLIGMRLVRELGLRVEEQSTLFYALLLKDAGCSSNSLLVTRLFGGNDQQVKHRVWMHDWRKASVRATNVGAALRPTRPVRAWAERVWRLARNGSASVRELYRVRCDRGAEIARAVGFTEATAAAVHAMDEHWDGGGYPLGRRRAQIPFAARVIGLAQVAELFWREGGPAHALDVVRGRSGQWFDPELVQLFATLEGDGAFWESLTAPDVGDRVAAAEPTEAVVLADEARLDQIAAAFAWVIDAKSPFTFHHSQQVASWSIDIGKRLGLSPVALTRLRRAALLHDIGKLGVPNRVLDHPGRLTDSDWELITRHPRHTYDILVRVPPFAEFAFDASAHHERPDGNGYHRGLRGRALTRTARILAVADNLDALLADRPYRAALAPEAVSGILKQGAGTAYCPVCAETGIAALNARWVQLPQEVPVVSVSPGLPTPVGTPS